MRIFSFFAVVFIVCFTASTARAQEVDCPMCHPGLSEGKSVHAAVMMGCPSCHAGVDAAEIPHKMTAGKGLSAEGAELCYFCHDKTEFYGPTIHAPVGIGLCTNCHNPHRSDNEKLLVATGSELCFKCHDESGFFKDKRSIHEPVKTGACLKCHMTHVSRNESLLIRKGIILCRKCHSNVLKEPHAVAGFKRAGHPLRGRKDPNRPGKTFECLSCHLPHSSESPTLYRYKAEGMFDLCSHCHDM